MQSAIDERVSPGGKPFEAPLRRLQCIARVTRRRPEFSGIAAASASEISSPRSSEGFFGSPTHFRTWDGNFGEESRTCIRPGTRTYMMEHGTLVGPGTEVLIPLVGVQQSVDKEPSVGAGGSFRFPRRLPGGASPTHCARRPRAGEGSWRARHGQFPVAAKRTRFRKIGSGYAGTGFKTFSKQALETTSWLFRDLRGGTLMV